MFSFLNKKDNKESAVDTSVKETGMIARNCLSLPAFKQYREQYATMESKVIGELIQEAANFCVSPDSMDKFGAKCLVKLTRLRDLRSLITKIENDSKKGLEEKKDGSEE